MKESLQNNNLQPNEDFDKEQELWIEQSWTFLHACEGEGLWEDLEILKWKNPWIKSWEIPNENEMKDEIHDTPHWPGKITWELPLGYQFDEDEKWAYDSHSGCDFFIGDIEKDGSDDFIVEKITCPWMEDVWGYSSSSIKLIELFERLDGLLEIPMDKWPEKVLARGYGRRKKALLLHKSRNLGKFTPQDSMQLLLSLNSWDSDGSFNKEIKALKNQENGTIV